jgi:transcriptional regulator with XRE-family HTH domain
VSKRSMTKSTRLSRKLKLSRVGLGLSQSEILNQLGFSESLFRSNISQYERGARVPSPTVLLQYSRLAKIDLAVLIDDDMDLPARFTPQRKVSRKK